MNSDSNPPYPPKYVMFSENQGTIRPPPYRRNIPRYHSKTDHGSGKNCFTRFLCCFCCSIFLFIFIVAAIILFVYAFYQPQPPSYKVDNFNVKAFNLRPDLSLFTEFVVTVKADNPNENIGFTYGKDSSVVVLYSDSQLCSGKLPNFYQPKKNLTMIDVELKGNSEFGSGLQQALMDNRHSGKIPLLVMVKVPVITVLGDFPLKQVKVHVNCSLVVDNLSPGKKAGILSSKYEYQLLI